MNDKELADAVVALGVGRAMTGGREGLYGIGPHGSMSPEKWVRFWPVAGALMEKVWALRNQVQKLPIPDIRKVTFNPESLPRAIIEACVEAL